MIWYILSFPTIIWFVWLFVPEKPPADDGNVFNKLRHTWWSLTRFNKYASFFLWMRNDEWKNMNSVTGWIKVTDAQPPAGVPVIVRTGNEIMIYPDGNSEPYIYDSTTEWHPIP